MPVLFSQISFFGKLYQYTQLGMVSKITPSGRKYMEEMLQLQQKQLLAANENNASNGVK